MAKEQEDAGSSTDEAEEMEKGTFLHEIALKRKALEEYERVHKKARITEVPKKKEEAMKPLEDEDMPTVKVCSNLRDFFIFVWFLA